MLKVFSNLKNKIIEFFIKKLIDKMIKENKMLGNVMAWLNGKKTYLFALLWMVYKLGVGSGWWPENGTLETLLLGGGAVALREGVAKAK